jgi:hypothetical protein
MDSWSALNTPSLPFELIIAAGEINGRLYIVGRNSRGEDSMVSCKTCELLAASSVSASLLLSSTVALGSSISGVKPNLEWRLDHPMYPLGLYPYKSLIWDHRFVIYDVAVGVTPSSVWFFDTRINTWHIIAPIECSKVGATFHLLVYRNRLCYFDDGASNPLYTYNEVTDSWIPLTEIVFTLLPKVVNMCIPTYRPSSSCGDLKDELLLICDDYSQIQRYDSDEVKSSSSSSSTTTMISKGSICLPKSLMESSPSLVVLGSDDGSNNEWLIVMPTPSPNSPPFGMAHINNLNRENEWRWYDCPPIPDYHLVTINHVECTLTHGKKEATK